MVIREIAWPDNPQAFAELSGACIYRVHIQQLLLTLPTASWCHLSNVCPVNTKYHQLHTFAQSTFNSQHTSGNFRWSQLHLVGLTAVLSSTMPFTQKHSLETFTFCPMSSFMSAPDCLMFAFSSFNFSMCIPIKAKFVSSDSSRPFAHQLYTAMHTEILVEICTLNSLLHNT